MYTILIDDIEYSFFFEVELVSNIGFIFLTPDIATVSKAAPMGCSIPSTIVPVSG